MQTHTAHTGHNPRAIVWPSSVSPIRCPEIRKGWKVWIPLSGVESLHTAHCHTCFSLLDISGVCCVALKPYQQNFH